LSAENEKREEKIHLKEKKIVRTPERDRELHEINEASPRGLKNLQTA